MLGEILELVTLTLATGMIGLVGFRDGLERGLEGVALVVDGFGHVVEG